MNSFRAAMRLSRDEGIAPFTIFVVSVRILGLHTIVCIAH